MSSSDRLKRFLKIEERQSENLTVLDENGKLKIFNSAKEIIKYFVEFRLKHYDKRKKYLIDSITEKLLVLSNKAAFIKAIIDGKLKINNVPKATIVTWLEKAKFDKYEASYNYLLSMPIHTLTKEKYEELLAQKGEREVELEKIKATKPVDMYVTDLEDLKNSKIIG